MAIDTKTTAGSVVLLFLSGSGSYLATNAVNGETTAPTTSLEGGQTRSGNPEEGQPTLETRKEQDETSARDEEAATSQNPTETVNSTGQNQAAVTNPQTSQSSSEQGSGQDQTGKSDSENTQGTPNPEVVASTQSTGEVKTTQPEEPKNLTDIMKKKISERKFENVESTEETCINALNQEFSEENLKAAVLACFKTKTLKDRATQLGIQLIDNANGSTLFNQRFSTLGADVVKDLAEKTKAANIQTESGQATTNTVPDFCKKVEVLTWSSINSATYSIEKEWEGYLKICAKEIPSTTNFWTEK